MLAKNSSPLFKVKAEGLYGIHTLVYDPTKLNPDTLFPPKNYKVPQLLQRFKTSNALLCAGIDSIGAQFAFNECDTCGVFAGTLRVLAQKCLDNGLARLQAVTVTAPTFPVPSNYKVIYVLTSGNDLVLESLSATPDFIVRKAGIFTIHTLVYDPAKLNLGIFDPGEYKASDLLKLLIQGGGTICGALDVGGAKFEVSVCPCSANPGALVAASQPCINTGSVQLTANRILPTVVPTGFQVRYILTRGEDLTIMQIGQNPQFTVAQTGRYRIHTLVYDPSTLDLSGVVLGTTKASAINSRLVQGGGLICAALDLFGATFDVTSCPCEPTAGKLKPEAQVCYDNLTPAKLTALIDVAPVVPAGYQRRYVLTFGPNLVIEGVSQNPTFTVAKTGNFRIHTVVFNPADLDMNTVIIGSTRATDINKLLIQGGGPLCGALDLTGAVFEVTGCPCAAKAGTLVAIDQPCLNAGSARIRANVNVASVLPAGYQVRYILTQGDVLVVRQIKTVADFTVTAAGRYRVHTFVYNPSSFNINDIQIGITTGQAIRDRLIEGGGSICGSIHLSGLTFDVSTCAPTCSAGAGTLKVLDQTCLPVGGTARLRAATLQAPSVPEGFLLRYVLTSGDNLVIQNINSSADFLVPTTGRYRIHTLVYNPATLNLTGVIFGSTRASAIASQLIQGGGQVCGALDVTGAVFDVINCANCTAYSGTLIPANGPCLDNWWDARLRAATKLAPVIPNGYQLRYLVSFGSDQVITDIGDKPDFIVHTTGTWRIHALVYNPSTFNLAEIVKNSTTIEQLKVLLVRGIVPTCASLDETGAVFYVKPCEGCAVEAGTLKPKAQVCLNALTGARLQADPDRAPVVPTGFVIKYLLTYGDNMTILLIGDSPDFTVGNTGSYRIHRLVYHPSNWNPATAIQLGVTMLKTVKQTFIQDGGTTCAAVDPVGAYFVVSPCQQTCGVTAGTLIPYSQPCLDNWGEVELKAYVGTQPNVPSGYVIRYLLTTGDNKVILKVSSSPVFELNATGKYRIHTLVYHPNTLNFTIYPGSTLLSELNALLIQGGGAVCGALDLNGAYFDIKACTTCVVSTGKLKAKVPNCLTTGGVVTLSTEVLIAPTVPQGWTVCYAIVNSNGVIVDVTESPSVIVRQPGTYCMHTFVFPNAQFNVSRIIEGTTTLNQLKLWLNDLCSAIDLSGVCFTVNTCTPTCDVFVGKLNPRIPNCLPVGGISTLIADFTTAAVVPTGYTICYAIVKNGVIVDVTEQPSAVVRATGTYCMHTFIFPTAYFNVNRIIENTTTIIQLSNWLKDYCAAIDLNGVCFTVLGCTNTCNVDAGKVSIPTNLPCLVDSFKLCVNIAIPPSTPSGFTVCYAMVDDKGVIVDVVEDKCFWVKKKGTYCVHVFVFRALTFNPNLIIKGVTKLSQLNSWLTGGNVCGHVDMIGACFTVRDCLPVCNPTTGTLVPDLEECLSIGYAWIAAKHPAGGASYIPAGFSRRYLLVTADNVIRQIELQPKFGVNQTGSYRVLTLVYDQNTLPLNSNIILGTTTVAQLNAKLIQGGGVICAALDLVGASIYIKSCVCTADAGRLKTSGDVCLPKNGERLLTASTLTTSTVPAGYAIRYLLTKGANKVIIDYGTNPSFSVAETGTYRIHVLVFNQATFPLANIQLNVTTINSLRAQFIEGGGAICASVEPTGAVFEVAPCYVPCLVTPGKLVVVGEPCLVNGQGIFSATVSVAPVAPAGYLVRYILTSTDNRVIRAISSSPSFSITTAGRYRIHTLVYLPGTLNLNVTFGTTQLSFISNQITGDVCAALDTGVLFEIANCQLTCVAFAGTLKPVGDSCKSTLPTVLQAMTNIPPIVPVNYQVRYLLASGANQVIEQISTQPNFNVNSQKVWSIHTLVYDPATFAIGSIQTGVTTIPGLKTGIGSIACISLDDVGVRFSTDGCCSGMLGEFKPWVTVPCIPLGTCAYLKFDWKKAPVIPKGWKIIYLVSAANSQVISSIYDRADFFICTRGKYSVHQLIYNPNEINPYKLIGLGESTINDLKDEFASSKCIYYDHIGFKFEIQWCTYCGMLAGAQLYPIPAPCFVPGGVNIKASLGSDNMFQPPSKVYYVLTKDGDTNILGVSTTPEFKVTQAGKYRIILVILDPFEVNIYRYSNLLDLILQFKQGGGKYCGYVDPNGASFNVKECNSFGEIPTTEAYPNPTTDRVKLVFKDPKLVDEAGISVEVLNINGRIINREKFDAGVTEGELDMKSLPSGLYLIRVMRSGQAPELIRINKM
ncbi:MAG TPA: T9SS type A sorting domain-containing protein [Haliscomenobacter sp.]|uniref:T9SS type A sorting domain-containing protein n=1 Tax=Haliscomenobacter sp. TaxID=2717303 RepID=UPI002B55B8AE|nr:T9SS type A sorting domain-containing protein [Haliscomenobacter sp.]HOY16859.1 T9SS type A sorting domain-containing protein [Haliscomenobacter sp.]